MVVVMRTEKKVSEETVYGRAGSPASRQCNGRLRFVTPDERQPRARPDQRQPSLPSAQLISLFKYQEFLSLSAEKRPRADRELNKDLRFSCCDSVNTWF